MQGNDIDGTFCEYAVAYSDFVTPIPDGVDSAGAAAIMCAVRVFIGPLVLSVETRRANHRYRA